MQEFSKNTIKSILRIFLNKTKNFQEVNEIINQKSNDEKIRLKITLHPKNQNFNKIFDVLIISFHCSKKLSIKKEFKEFTEILFDDNNSLLLKLKFIEKLILSYCVLSPFVNFFNNENSSKIKLIKKDFILDYSIEKIFDSQTPNGTEVKVKIKMY